MLDSARRPGPDVDGRSFDPVAHRWLLGTPRPGTYILPRLPRFVVGECACPPACSSFDPHRFRRPSL